MCKRCRDHLQILTEDASPVSQGNPTLVDIFSSQLQTPAGDTLEEKRSESSQHKSTQVVSEKVLCFCKCLLGRYHCFPNVGTPTLVKGKICVKVQFRSVVVSHNMDALGCFKDYQTSNDTCHLRNVQSH